MYAFVLGTLSGCDSFVFVPVIWMECDVLLDKLTLAFIHKLLPIIAP